MMKTVDKPVMFAVGAVLLSFVGLTIAQLSPHVVGQELNSNFATSLVGAFAGAIGGAYAAQKLADKSKIREWLTSEIRITNAAIMVAFDTCNTLLIVKAQHVVPIKENWERQRAEFDESLKRVGGVLQRAQYYVHMDLKALHPPSTEVGVLRTMAFEKLSLPGRPVVIVATLVRCIQSLNHALAAYNAAIDEFRNSGPHPEEERCRFYFGLRSDQGVMDERYRSSVEGISIYIDYGIWYSQRLCKELTEYGDLQAEEWVKKVGGFRPHIKRISFDGARQDGLIPDDKDYEPWLKAFEANI